MNRPRTRPLLFWPLTALWFAGWHLLLIWYVWADPTRFVPGPLGDNVVMLWNLGWVRHALNHGSLGAWFPTAYYPHGFLFLFGTPTWLDGFLGWLASPLLPPGVPGIVLWANITQLAASVATGVAAVAALMQWQVRRWPILILAATALTFCWFRSFASSGHYHFYGTEWMVASLALCSRGRRLLRAGFARPGYRFSVLAGLMLGVTFLNDQAHTVFALILGTVMLLSLWTAIRCTRKQAILAFLFLGTSAFLIALIHLIPIALSVYNGKFSYWVPMLDLPRYVDASSLFLPNDRHILLGNRLDGLRTANHLAISEGTTVGTVQLGLLFLALLVAFAGLKTRFRGGNPGSMPVAWATGFALLFLIAAMGDYLKIGDTIYGMMPGRLLRSIPIINNIRLPQRWVWPAQLCICLAGALALTRIFRMHIPRLLSAFLLCIAAFAAAESKFYPASEAVDMKDKLLHFPALTKSVRYSYKSGGVLAMPMEYAYAHSNVLQLQWGYEIPITTAYTARAPFDVTATPWRGPQWTPESVRWLKDKQVSIVVFTFHGGKCGEYEPWIRDAKAALPELLIFNRDGEAQ